MECLQLSNRIKEEFLQKSEPVRLNKYLSEAGVCSRREADRLIETGRVTVDGQCAQTGMRIVPGQVVKVGNKVVSKQDEMILSFYGTVAGWTLEYVFKSFTFSFHAGTDVDLNTMYSDFITNSYKPVFWQIVFMTLTGFIVLAGVKKGIERYTKLMMPLLFVLIVILGIRACTLDGAMEGIKFLFLPKFSELTSRGGTFCSGTSLFLLVNRHGCSLDLCLLHQKG